MKYHNKSDLVLTSYCLTGALCNEILANPSLLSEKKIEEVTVAGETVTRGFILEDPRNPQEAKEQGASPEMVTLLTYLSMRKEGYDFLIIRRS
ncbi:hypothetical protein ACXWTF_13040 [Thiomicrolovo sp. ZZH C-3]